METNGCKTKTLQSAPCTTTATFSDLKVNTEYTCGVGCKFNNVERDITRRFTTPKTVGDCSVILVNDGISFHDYSVGGTIASVTFEWSSIGSHVGFNCSVDEGTPFSCEL